MNAHPQEDIEVARESRCCGIRRGRAHAVLGLFFMAAALLNGEALLRDAELMTFGRPRDWAICAARPLAAAARATGLHRPRAWMERQVPGI